MKILWGGTFIGENEIKSLEPVGKDQDDGQGGGQANAMARQKGNQENQSRAAPFPGLPRLRGGE